MGGAVGLAMIGFGIALRFKAPLLAEAFDLPQRIGIDARLISGAALFGVGWGLVGFCPGPALTALGFGRWEPVPFVAAMVVGMLLFNRVATLPRTALGAHR